jgi:hypothetical protein
VLAKKGDPIAERPLQQGGVYDLPFGLTQQLGLYRSYAFEDGEPLFYACAGVECAGRDLLPPDEMTWTIDPETADDEGDSQVARLEKEPGPTADRPSDPEAGWYLRGIRMTTKPDGTPRVANGVLELHGSSENHQAIVTTRIVKPEHLGEQTDGYPVSYGDNEYSLEEIVIRHADTYGIPPHYLMSQVAKEASKTSSKPLRLNPYSYRYEPYGFDFRFISGDEAECCRGTTHSLLDDPDTESHQGQPFHRAGLPSQASKIEVLPFSTDFGDVIPLRAYGAKVTPVGSLPTATLQIANVTGPIQWNVRLYDPTEALTFSRTRPGKALSLANAFTVDCYRGIITLGEPVNDAAHLRVDYTPVVVRRENVGEFPHFGNALATAPSTAEINQHGPNQITPPVDPHTTIAQWATGRPCNMTLTQKISRYNDSFTPEESCALLTEDPSFGLQGQYYGGASFGLLQVWPANAATTIRSAPAAKQEALWEIFNPLAEPGTKLFDPDIGVRFGAATDRYIDVRDENDSHQSFEGACPSDSMTPPSTACTWERWWARRFTAFNMGSDPGECDPKKPECYTKTKFTEYGRAIVTGAAAFAPVPPPTQ